MSRLCKLEKKYGGHVKGITPKVFSSHDKNRKRYPHEGGDRMNNDRYASLYEAYFDKYINEKIIIAEVGILTGIGLAVWSDFFSQAKVYGFDIDLSNFDENLENLKSLGAFKKALPIVNEMDQFVCNKSYLKTIFNENKIDIVIDDGCHQRASAIKTFNSFEPFLSKDYLYVIEDQDFTKKLIFQDRADLMVWSYKENITFISPK